MPKKKMIEKISTKIIMIVKKQIKVLSFEGFICNTMLHLYSFLCSTHTYIYTTLSSWSQTFSHLGLQTFSHGGLQWFQTRPRT